MKKITLAVTLSALCFALFAQDKLPSFGKIDKADLEMKDCDFDPGAEALVLFDVGEIQYTYIEGTGWQSEAVYRTKIKIFKNSALNNAEIKLPFYSNNRYEQIINVSAISYNLDALGNIEETKMGKDAVYNKPLNKENSEISFAIPNVKAGSVFEYKYTMLRKFYGYIPSWVFQKRLPVKYSSYNLNIPEFFQYTSQTVRRQELEQKETKFDGTWFIMRKVPGLKKEPFSSGFDDYKQKIDFQISRIVGLNNDRDVRSTWPQIINELLESDYFGQAIKKNINGTGNLNADIAAAKSTKEKIRIVYKYVQANMQWNEDYSRYTDNGIKDAWDKKNGNIADINFILIRLLRDAGVDAKPLLVSTKENGAINTFYPFLNQFNAVTAYVKDGDEYYVLNAADKYNAFTTIPYDVLYTNGLVVDKENGGLVGLNSNNKYTNNISFTCAVQPDAKISGEAVISCADYARNIRMNTFKTGKLKSMLEDNEGINVKVDSFEVKNEKDEMLPLEQKVNFSGSMQEGGGYYFLPCTVFTGMGKNLFIAEDRVMDIDFSYPKSYIVSGSYILPEGFEVNELPKNTKMIMPDTSIVLTRIVQNDNGIISFKFSLDLIAPGYSADSYPYVKEFFKKMYAIIDERIVIKKK